MKGSKETYGIPILKYMELNKISWVAWCYDTIWEPKIFKDKSWKTSEYTEWGEFIVNELKKLTQGKYL